MSGAYFAGDSQLLKDMPKYKGERKKLRFWIDCGNGNYEGDDINAPSLEISGHTKHIAGDGLRLLFEQNLGMPSILKSIGYEYEKDFQYSLSYTDAHNEAAWNKRAYHALKYIYSKNEPTIQKIDVKIYPKAIKSDAAVKSALIIADVTHENGMTVTVPVEELSITSDSSFYIDYGKIMFDEGDITSGKNIEFTVTYKELTSSVVLTIQ